MSIKTKEMTSPAHKYEVVESVTCDICGLVHKSPNYDGDDSIDWGNGPYDIDSTMVSHGKGMKCRDGGDMEYREYHICPKCFADELEPWLKSKGAKPTKRTIDY